MNCPHCKKELVEGKDPSTHIKYLKCNDCNGVLANFDKVSNNINSDELKELFSLTPNKLNTGLNCPKCKEQLHEVIFDPEKSYLQLDICNPCNLVWFDFLEFSRLKKTTANNNTTSASRELSLLKASFEISQQNKINKIKAHKRIISELSQAAHRVYYSVF